MTAFALTLLLAGWPGIASAAPSGWDLARAHEITDGAGVLVGVVDTGVAPVDDVVRDAASFPDLDAGPVDPRGHGTTMALLVHSVAPAAGILSARLTGGPADANAAIRWAVDRGARVLNLSLGGTPGSTAFDEGLRYARDHDVVVVAAAGNTSTDPRVVSPADREGVLAVSAVDDTGRFRPDVSVSGPEVFLSAPGVDLTTPNLDRGHSGTSQAAALVSGVVALVRARNPDWDAGRVADRLAATATDEGPAGRDPSYGYGIVDPVRALTPEPEHGYPVWVWLLPLILVWPAVAWRGQRRMRSKCLRALRQTGRRRPRPVTCPLSRRWPRLRRSAGASRSARRARPC